MACCLEYVAGSKPALELVGVGRAIVIRVLLLPVARRGFDGRVANEYEPCRHGDRLQPDGRLPIQDSAVHLFETIEHAVDGIVLSDMVMRVGAERSAKRGIV